MGRDFDGTDDRIDWANVFTTSGQAMTISVLAFPDVVSRTTQQYFFNGSVAGGAGTIFTIGDTVDSPGVAGTLRFVRVTNGNLKARSTASSTLAAGSWQHCLCTDDGSLTAVNAHIYINGAEPSYMENINGSGTESTANGLWNIGGRSSDNNRNFNGRLANLGIWNRVLSAGEIATLSKGYSPLFILNGLRFCCHFQGQSPEINLLGAASSSTVGTTVTDHPFTLYPAMPFIGMSGAQIFDEQLALDAIAAMQPAVLADFQAQLALGALAQLIQAVEGTFEPQIVLATLAAMVGAVQADMEPSLSLGALVQFFASGGSVFDEQLALAAIAAMQQSPGHQLQVQVALAAAAALQRAVQADIQPSLVLNSLAALQEAVQADMQPSLGLNGLAALLAAGSTGGQIFDVQLLLAALAGLKLNRVIPSAPYAGVNFADEYFVDRIG